MKVAYYLGSEDDRLSQPLVYGLKAIGYSATPWAELDTVAPLAEGTIFILFARAKWNDDHIEQIQGLMQQQVPCYIASPCNISDDKNPCLKSSVDMFAGDLPVIYPPFTSSNLVKQLGVPAGIPLRQHANRVLLVDDSPSLLAVMELYIKDLGYQCYATTSAQEALTHLAHEEYDILVTDYQMDEMTGVDLINQARGIHNHLLAVLVTAFGVREVLLDAINAHVDEFIEKPVEQDALKGVLARLDTAINLRKDNSKLLVELTESNSYLKEGRDILNATLECLNEAVLTLDSQYSIISSNSALTKLTDYQVQDVLGKSPMFLLQSKCWEHLLRAFEERKGGISYEGVLKRKDDSCFPVWITLRKSTEMLRNVYILVLQDITSQKQVEDNLLSENEALESKVAERTKKLKEAKEEAERANHSKSEFLANMSHELRTPMHAIMSFNSLIDRTISNQDDIETIREKVSGFIHRIGESSQRLLKLINNLLDISKLESGHLELHAGKQNILGIIDEVKNEIAPLIEEKHIKIHISSDIEAPVINIDAEKMAQVLHNLFSNAVKFSPKDSTISIQIEPSEINVERRSNATYIVPSIKLSICDQGIGIPEDELASIFDKFIQSSQTKTGAGGTGLGLAICKEIINLHRGEIYATNNQQGGACFVFNLPVDPIDFAAMNAANPR